MVSEPSLTWSPPSSSTSSPSYEPFLFTTNPRPLSFVICRPETSSLQRRNLLPSSYLTTLLPGTPNPPWTQHQCLDHCRFPTMPSTLLLSNATVAPAWSPILIWSLQIWSSLIRSKNIPKKKKFVQVTYQQQMGRRKKGFFVFFLCLLCLAAREGFDETSALNFESCVLC